MKSRWKLLYPVTLIISLGNLLWFLNNYKIASRGVYLFFKIFLIYTLLFYVYRLTIILLGKIHRGLPLALILLFGYLFGGTGPSGVGTLRGDNLLLTALWFFGGATAAALTLTAFTRSIRSEEEQIPRETQFLLNLLIPAGITAGISYPTPHLIWTTSLILVLLTLTLIIMGRRIRTHPGATRTLTGVTIALVLVSLWFDLPHRPPRLQTHRRSLVLITLEGIRPAEVSSLNINAVKTLRFPNAWAPSPLPSHSMKVIWGSGIQGYLPDFYTKETERHAVINGESGSLPESLARGFDTIESPRLSPDILLAGANLWPTAITGNLITSNSWKSICMRRNASTVTRIAERILGSVKEPFLLWVAYPSPDRGGEMKPISTPSERKAFLTLHDREVKRTTGSVNHLLGYLSSHNFFPHTQVVVVGLNGYARFEHGSLGPSLTLYPEMIHVPLVIFSTFIRNDGEISSDLPLSYLTATLANLAKVKTGEDGRSILTDPPILASWQDSLTTKEGAIHLITTPDDFLLVHDSTSSVELYDRKNDPACLKDIHLCQPDRVERILSMEGVKR